MEKKGVGVSGGTNRMDGWMVGWIGGICYVCIVCIYVCMICL